ncbi:MAG: hypothetical protein AAF519_14120 [Bacteroidota bacterium]
MLRKHNVGRILLSPFTLAIVITLGILYFFPNPVVKYRTVLIEQKQIDKNAGLWFKDLNGDGEAEQINSRPFL